MNLPLLSTPPWVYSILHTLWSDLLPRAALLGNLALTSLAWFGWLLGTFSYALVGPFQTTAAARRRPYVARRPLPWRASAWRWANTLRDTSGPHHTTFLATIQRSTPRTYRPLRFRTCHTHTHADRASNTNGLFYAPRATPLLQRTVAACVHTTGFSVARRRVPARRLLAACTANHCQHATSRIVSVSNAS